MNRHELATRKPEGGLAHGESSIGDMKPFQLLMVEHQRPAVELWSQIRMVKDLESAMSLVGMILNAIASGLHRDDVSELLRRLKHPHHLKDVKFATDFTTKFQAIAADLIDQRQNNVTMKRLRGESDPDERPASGHDIKTMTSRLLSEWGENESPTTPKGKR